LTPPLPTLCLVRDLLFASKITVAAGHAGVTAVVVRDPSKLVDRDGSQLLVDLNQDGALAAAIAWRQRTGKPVVGFVSHVDTATIATARDAGIDRVLARSAFTAQLPQILRLTERPI
jgi:hypothetical protein